MINSILLVDDESLFHLVFEEVNGLLDIALNIETIYSTEQAEIMFKEWASNPEKRPDCAFIDLNIIGSSIDGIELIRKLKTEYDSGVVAGIISSSADETEQARAVEAGAQFWIVKTDEIEPRLESFKADYLGFKNKTAPFKVYC
ncbi:MAG: response regulator [Bacteroidetes bacterium]|nr:response regulator [Bacteroidota bacterium]